MTAMTAMGDRTMLPSQPEQHVDVNLDPVLPHLDVLLAKRQHPKTLCPSEVARALSQEELEEAGASQWRDLMPCLRSLCFQLRDEGKLEILQKGNVLPRSQGIRDTSGPIRIRKLIR